MDEKALDRIIRAALKEDIQLGDVTTNSIVPSESVSRAVIFAKENAVLCGIQLACGVFNSLNKKIKCQCHFKDGEKITPFRPVLTLKGPSRSLLTGERTALNFLSYLSAIATQTQQFVEAVKPYRVKIMDTRKTTPTLRHLERYAVKCGGGVNHRDDLSSMAMIKDNHWVLSGHLAINAMVQQIHKNRKVAVELEVDDLTQFKQALASKVDIILLDNMSPGMVRKAVDLRKKLKSPILLEVSGGVNLKTVRLYAQTGVERISVGSLTHSRRAVDFSMEILKK